MASNKKSHSKGRFIREDPVKRKKKRPVWLLVVAVLIAAAAGGAYFLAGPPGASEAVEVVDPVLSAESPQTVPTALQPADPVEETAAETETAQTQPTQSPTSKPPAASGSKPNPPKPAPTQPSPIQEEISSGDITCDEFGRYSGQYVEDGRDELVENVAAVRVTNRSDQFLDFATITVDISGRTATFVVSGLPAGRSAWVLDAARLPIGESESFEFLDCVSSFRSDVIVSTDRVTIKVSGNMLTATNNTSQTLENVFLYYRTLHSDGYFLGGITYLAGFGTLEPGQSMDVLAGHYDSAKSEIVRIGWTAE